VTQPCVIDVRLTSIGQLVHAFDPSPFHERDLAGDAENYIVEAARECPRREPLAIRVHLPAAQVTGKSEQDIANAIRQTFANRARSESNSLRRLFKAGRRAALIGFTIFGLCLTASWWLSVHHAGDALGKILAESLIIFGWVAIWRPSEIFLYDWHPIAEDRKLYARLAAAKVEVGVS